MMERQKSESIPKLPYNPEPDNDLDKATKANAYLESISPGFKARSNAHRAAAAKVKAVS